MMKSISRKTSAQSNLEESGNGLKSLRFEDAAASVPPNKSSLSAQSDPTTQVTDSTPDPINGKHPVLSDNRLSLLKKRSYVSDDPKRDSVAGPSLSMTANGSTTQKSWDQAPMIPAIVVEDDTSTSYFNTNSSPPSKPTEEKVPLPSETANNQAPPADFKGIETPIETGDIDDPFSSEEMQFSKRGSMLLGDERLASILGHGGKAPSRMQSLREKVERPMSTQDHQLSKRVRSMYECGDEKAWEWLKQPSPIEEREGEVLGADKVPELRDFSRTLNSDTVPNESASASRSPSSLSNRRASLIKKEPWEAAGGIEDWKDVDGGDVDRYGFIKPRGVPSRGSSSKISTPVPGSPDPHGRKRSAEGLTPVAESSQSGLHQDINQTPPTSKSNRLSLANRKGRSSGSLKPKNSTSPSIYSSRSKLSTSSTLKRRSRWMAEAPDMIDMSPDFGTLPEEDRTPQKIARERRREEKWAKMAKTVDKPTNTNSISGTTAFTFDGSNPKVISRTWKGIPDRWRATAWHSFLTASAIKQQGKSAPTEEDLVEDFHALQELDCVDDSQIDADVPRTIGGHIMFRRRYRGGQRLMFRVLHALALYFPDTGYVQGMAPLAATLLCYYDEERAFVMAVRLWSLRGLQVLYKPGFEGLFGALEDFESSWLKGRELKKRLDELDIKGTSYGTKWYLTLFSYSIPFAAQLRVWDVFMLLGDPPSMVASKKRYSRALASAKSSEQGGPSITDANFDILHATSAALLDGLQEVLLDAEFENAMKTLTSAVPVTNEDLLMKVAKREFKERKKRS